MDAIKKLMDKDLSYFKINPIVHLKGFIGRKNAIEILAQLSQINFDENLHEGEIVRYEISIKEAEFDFIKQIKRILQKFSLKLGFQKDYSCDFYVFKYHEGNFVPEHQDKERHKILFMIYVGTFKGGDYVYKHNNQVHRIQLSPGDAVLSINELGPGNWQNPIHSVDKISRGIRYTIAGSLVPKC